MSLTLQGSVLQTVKNKGTEIAGKFATSLPVGTSLTQFLADVNSTLNFAGTTDNDRVALIQLLCSMAQL